MTTTKDSSNNREGNLFDAVMQGHRELTVGLWQRRGTEPRLVLYITPKAWPELYADMSFPAITKMAHRLDSDTIEVAGMQVRIVEGIPRGRKYIFVEEHDA